MRLQLDLLWQVSRVIILETVDYRVQAVVQRYLETKIGAGDGPIHRLLENI